MGKMARQIELLLRLQIGSFASTFSSFVSPKAIKKVLSKSEDSNLNSLYSTDTKNYYA